MKSNISVFKFLKQFPTEDACEQWIISARWPTGINCPNCGNHRVYRIETQKRFKCGDCKKQFTVRTNSILAESKVPLQKWLMAVWILTSHPKGVSSIQLAKTLEVTQKTAWFLAHRIREAFNERGGLFTGEVEETYIGGKEKNKHSDKRLNEGRGAVGKKPVVGLKQRDGKIKSISVDDTTSNTLHKIIKKHVAKGAILCTDEHRSYKGLNDYTHLTVNHSVGEYLNGLACTNSIESFWAMLKHGFYGVYHKMSFPHLNRYINEFTFRHNVNSLSCMEVIGEVFYNSNGKRLSYNELKSWQTKLAQ